MQLLLLFAAWILTSGLSVFVKPIEGPTYQAELTGANDDYLNLVVNGQARQVPLADLQSVIRAESEERFGPKVRATLLDGTQLPVEDIQLDGQLVTLKLRRQGVLTVPVRSLGVLRFQSPSAPLDAQWSGYLKQTKPNDQLVIRRSFDTLDAVGGAVKSIGDKLVQFELNGAPVDAPFDRLEGIVFARHNATPATAGKLRVKDVFGASWNAKRLDAGSRDNTLTVITAGDLQHEIRIDLIHSIELSSGTLFLANLEPLAQSYQPFIVAPQTVSAENTTAWLGPRIQDNHTLVVPSRSTISYRIEPGFSRFVAEVQIDPSLTLGGECELKVRFGDDVAWEQTLKIGEPAKKIELPLANASRLTIEVDYGGDGDIGDVVHIREPRFLK